MLLSLQDNRWVSSASWSNDLLQTQGPLAAEAFSHVAFTWDGTARRLFIDGREVAADAPAPFSTAAGELRIGATDVPTARRFVGMLDDVRIFDYARTPAQLRKNVDQSIHYAFAAADPKTDSGPNKTSFGTTSATGVTAVADRAATAGAALGLDGKPGTYFQIFPVSSLGKSRSYTVAVWVKPTIASGTLVHLSTGQDGTGWCISMLGLDPAGKPTASSWMPGSTVVASDKAIAAGRWTHLATSFSASALKIYVDGILAKSVFQPGFVGSGVPDYVTLGSPMAGAACAAHAQMPGSYSGALDELRIWDRELTAAEIAAEAK
jgi:sialidase-1